MSKWAGFDKNREVLNVVSAPIICVRSLETEQISLNVHSSCNADSMNESHTQSFSTATPVSCTYEIQSLTGWRWRPTLVKIDCSSKQK